MIIRAKAPLRISFSGGGTDVSPYPEECDGCVLSCTIDKYSYTTLIPRDSSRISFKSLDYDTLASYELGEEFSYDGNLELVKGTLKVIGINEGHGDLTFLSVFQKYQGKGK